MDFAEAINALLSFYDESGWQIDGLENFPDLAGYRKHETGNSLFPIKYSKVQGDCEGFGGIEYYETQYSNGDGGKLFLKVEIWG